MVLKGEKFSNSRVGADPGGIVPQTDEVTMADDPVFQPRETGEDIGGDPGRAEDFGPEITERDWHAAGADQISKGKAPQGVKLSCRDDAAGGGKDTFDHCRSAAPRPEDVDHVGHGAADVGAVRLRIH